VLYYIYIIFILFYYIYFCSITFTSVVLTILLHLHYYTHWFWLRIVPFTWFGHTDFDYRYLKWGSRRVWPVSRGCLLLLSTWSYLCICRRSVLPYTRFCNCLLDYGYVLHIVNSATLYLLILYCIYQCSLAFTDVLSHF
jgi:hypothetical protein